jgi:guanidinoacetate N-methyltransferase
MTRRIKRHSSFELTLEIKDETFIRTPHERQRNWLLNRAIKELSDELLALDSIAGELVAGGDPLEIGEREQTELSEQDIMEDWQIPVMRAMSQLVCRPGADVLEVGFGRGVASSMIQEAGVGSHTIVECNSQVIGGYYRDWSAGYPGRDIRMIEGLWQEVTDQLQSYDGIFFHTYPLNDEEYRENVAQSVTFAGHFFSTASRHLKPGGAFTYLTNERDSLSRGHQRLLLDYFSSFSVGLVQNLDIPQSSRDSHWSNQMALVRAVK